jgi:hypothetical protein
MTTPEFLDLLADLSGRFDWTLMADTGLATDERRREARFHLRASPKSVPSATLDPLRAMAFARTGNIPDTWAEAAMVLEMTFPDATAIAAAASDRTWVGETGERVPARELMAIRQRLLVAVGIISSGRDAPEPNIV